MAASDMTWGAANCIAWVSWCGVFLRLLVLWASGDPTADVWRLPYMAVSVSLLEFLCVLEVVRMLVGSLRGNIALGIGLHYTRVFFCVNILPAVGTHSSCHLVLAAWALTEICRYPYYIFGGGRMLALRSAAPILTFPMGAGCETWACYTALPLFASGSIVRILTYVQIVSNIVIGALTYKSMLKRGLKALRGELSDGKRVKDVAEDGGILFPTDGKGGRSTTVAGRCLVTAAITGGGGDAAAKAAANCEREKNWRFGYARHFIKMVELGCEAPDVALGQARAGLRWAHDHFQFVPANAAEPVSISSIVDGKGGSVPASPFSTVRIEGPAKDVTRSICIPFNGSFSRGNTKPPQLGDVLQGAALKEQVSNWASVGVIEPDAARRAIGAVDYFEGGGSLHGYHFILIGATSAMGPAEHLLSLGAHVIGISRKSTVPGGAWRRLFERARSTPGAILEAPSTSTWPESGQSQEDVAAQAAKAAGADILSELEKVREWLVRVVAGLPAGDRVVIGNFTYLDGDKHVKLAVAADALITAVQKVNPKVGVAFLGTPTDAHVVPVAAHNASIAAFDALLRFGAPLETFVRLVTMGRKLAPAMRRRPLRTADRRTLHLFDGYVAAQGPNYALAKRLQHWRAMVTAAQGGIASNRVAPSTATVSVVHNRLFGWAYMGMPYFAPLEIFKEETASALMAAMLIADVVEAGGGPDTVKNPIEGSGSEAAHGGAFRCPYKIDTIGEVCVAVHFLGGPRCFKVLAAVLGWAAPVAAAVLLLRLQS
eukprot:TRINITY_DN20201_c0_g1_i1.p1 TRINITY_DN20201_c0_g1~~TRINITY_DN20201_c0_g1_i1.p1  ORF type:complete len:771 (+),score=136.15 TRINITY_DN20201_c0_g1_i1:83-2395(+)